MLQPGEPRLIQFKEDERRGRMEEGTLFVRGISAEVRTRPQRRDVSKTEINDANKSECLFFGTTLSCQAALRLSYG